MSLSRDGLTLFALLNGFIVKGDFHMQFQNDEFIKEFLFGAISI